jgi:hypothetical protein
MGLELGPILSFKGLKGNTKRPWRMSVLIVRDRAEIDPSLEWQAAGPAPAPATASTKATATLLATFPDDTATRQVWRFDFGVTLNQNPQKISYRIEGIEDEESRWEFHVPAKGTIPNMAYTSCTGFSSNKLMQKTEDPYGMVRSLVRQHEGNPYHLLLMGGDQVYADSMFDTLSQLHDWLPLPRQEKIAHPYTPGMASAVEQFYRELYVKRWRQKELRELFASIPSVMMWDDHDIFDGWGSYDPELQRSDVYRGLFASARDAFCLFQLQLAKDEAHPAKIPGQQAFSLGLNLGPLAILALDMRSERSDREVISQVSWKAAYDWLDTLTGECTHLLVMSSIPVVHPDFTELEKALSIFPGQQELEDDLRDQWNSTPHKQERLRLIHRLLDFSGSRQNRVTLLSGDVHVGALGVIRDLRSNGGTDQDILQLTSSGIIHPPPQGAALFFLENVVGKEMSTDRDISSVMIEFPGTRQFYIGARNWLALEPDAQRRIWANWHVEGQRYPYTQVILPVNFEMPKASVGKIGRPA